MLDALGLDDQISTSRADPWFEAAHHLTDAVRAWWGVRVQGIAYRPRTTPETSTNLAFFEAAPLVGTSVRLDRCTELLDRLVIARGFTIDFPY